MSNETNLSLLTPEQLVAKCLEERITDKSFSSKNIVAHVDYLQETYKVTSLWCDDQWELSLDYEGIPERDGTDDILSVIVVEQDRRKGILECVLLAFYQGVLI